MEISLCSQCEIINLKKKHNRELHSFRLNWIKVSLLICAESIMDCVVDEMLKRAEAAACQQQDGWMDGCFTARRLFLHLISNSGFNEQEPIGVPIPLVSFGQLLSVQRKRSRSEISSVLLPLCEHRLLVSALTYSRMVEN